MDAVDEEHPGREIAGALARYWAGDSGPSHASLASALALTGYDESQADAQNNKEQRVLLAVRQADADTAKLIVEELLNTLRSAGLGERRGGLDAAGIALVPAGGKAYLLLPWAILEELGVPTYVLFDGDAGIRDRVLRDAKSDEVASAAAANAAAGNQRIVAALDAASEPWPESQVTNRFTVFKDELETEFDTWTGFPNALEAARASLEEFRGKSDDAYRQAAAATEQDPPAIFSDLLDAVLRITDA